MQFAALPTDDWIKQSQEISAMLVGLGRSIKG
jgi:hypothetical protein